MRGAGKEEAEQGKEEVKEVAEHGKCLCRRPLQPHMGDESGPGQGLQTEVVPQGGSGLKMGETKSKEKGQVSLEGCQYVPQAITVRRGC